MGEWRIRRPFEGAVSRHRDGGRSIRIQVEVDLTTLIDPGFLQWMADQIRASAICPTAAAA